MTLLQATTSRPPTSDMRKRSQKLQKFVALASSEERHCGYAAGKSRQQLEEQLARLGDLNAYRAGYAHKSEGVDNINSAHWKDYQDFLSRLDHAVRSQQQVVKDLEQNFESHRRRWLAKRQRLESLERVLDRYRHEEQADAELREQRTLDDMPPRPDTYAAEADDK